METSLNGNTLCLFQYVEKHGKQLYETIRDRATDKQVFYVFGGVDAEQREKIREITEKSDNAIINTLMEGCMSIRGVDTNSFTNHLI